MNRDYVLITPVRNERKYIEFTIKSVISQIHKPLKWVIVSDSSTDGTDELVMEYSNEYDFIHLIRIEKRMYNGFREKVYVFNKGLEFLSNLDYTFIGNLDADVSFGKNYFVSLLECFEDEPQLGICGGHIHDVFGKGNFPHKISSNSVAGAVQFFRRECLQDIGGFFPLPDGCIDTAAEIMARYKGWKVRTNYNLRVHHHKPMKTGSSNIIDAKIKNGRSKYKMGYDHLFLFLSCVSRIFQPPFIIGSLGVFHGYLSAWIAKEKPVLPKEAQVYLKKEQRERLAKSFKGIKNT